MPEPSRERPFERRPKDELEPLQCSRTFWPRFEIGAKFSHFRCRLRSQRDDQKCNHRARVYSTRPSHRQRIRVERNKRKANRRKGFGLRVHYNFYYPPVEPGDLSESNESSIEQTASERVIERESQSQKSKILDPRSASNLRRSVRDLTKACGRN